MILCSPGEDLMMHVVEQLTPARPAFHDIHGSLVGISKVPGPVVLVQGKVLPEVCKFLLFLVIGRREFVGYDDCPLQKVSN